MLPMAAEASPVRLPTLHQARTTNQLLKGHRFIMEAQSSSATIHLALTHIDRTVHRPRSQQLSQAVKSSQTATLSLRWNRPHSHEDILSMLCTRLGPKQTASTSLTVVSCYIPRSGETLGNISDSARMVDTSWREASKPFGHRTGCSNNDIATLDTSLALYTERSNFTKFGLLTRFEWQLIGKNGTALLRVSRYTEGGPTQCPIHRGMACSRGLRGQVRWPPLRLAAQLSPVDGAYNEPANDRLAVLPH